MSNDKVRKTTATKRTLIFNIRRDKNFIAYIRKEGLENLIPTEGQRKTTNTLPKDLEWVDGGSVFERDSQKIILIKSYQVQEDIDSHDRQPADRTHHKEKEPGKNYLKLISFPILSFFVFLILSKQRFWYIFFVFPRNQNWIVN